MKSCEAVSSPGLQPIRSGIYTYMDSLTPPISNDLPKTIQFKLFSELRLLGVVKRHFIKDAAPTGLSLKKFLKALDVYSNKNYIWDATNKGHTVKYGS